uniref:Uncharacterized protein n=1 Tax=Arundo donax TaxID=35708 RepID=A0A0A9A421_ARUDO
MFWAGPREVCWARLADMCWWAFHHKPLQESGWGPPTDGKKSIDTSLLFIFLVENKMNQDVKGLFLSRFRLCCAPACACVESSRHVV